MVISASNSKSAEPKATKRQRIDEAIEIAKDYGTDVYWEGQVVWRHADWERNTRRPAQRG
ncbi:MAG TPA: hypothetical protein QGG93_10400 [Verrucomicrobiota bacterium]|nr:hypothetical protein [Verrucomicrobiota bacterium]